MTFNKINGAMLAVAAATLFSAGCATQETTSSETVATVKCAGVNACKGQGACATAQNACARSASFP